METTKLYELKKLQTNLPKEKISSSKTASDFIRQFYRDDIGIFESFFILLLNRQNQTIGYAKISQGGVSGTVVDVKIIAKYATDSLASAVILAHNHPSGSLQASPADLAMTTKITNALKLFDVKVFDHIILTEDSYYSMKDNGYI
jgi:DNA repair protein RadC